MAESPEEIRKHVGFYLKIFYSLGALTVVTVGASYISFPVAAGIFVALIIAVVKGSLVAGFFMHLLGERKIIYWMLVICFLMLLPLMFLPIWTISDNPSTDIAPPVVSAVEEHTEDGGAHEGEEASEAGEAH